jgi:Gpi18-like mannosyltransferase
MEKDYLKKIILITLLAIVCIFSVSVLGFYLLPFLSPAYYSNFHSPQNAPVSLATAFKTWDAQHYLFLAEKGYAPHQMSNAFYPLFPFLIKTFRPLFFGNSMLAGLALANLFSLVFIVFFYKFVRDLFEAQTAFIASLFLLAFPTGFYLSLIYTESLFLMLAIMFFYFLYQHKLWPALFTVFLLPLSRPQGILLLIPLGVFLLLPGVRKKIEYLLPLSLIAGLLVYFLDMQFLTGSFLAGITAQKYFVSNVSLLSFLNPLGWISQNFFYSSLSLHGFTGSLIDRFFFLCALVLLYFTYRKLDKVLFCYALLIALTPVFTGSFMSYTRYFLLSFPFFITLSTLLKEKSAYLIIPLVVAQTLFLLAHSLNFWVA